jgi:prepilin-type N-terminal cleavage/methylation domain-containing protein
MKKGMSLIEIVTVLFILSILVLMGATSFHRLEPKYRLLAAASEVFSRLNQARFRAILDGAPVRLKFTANRYDLEEWNNEQETWSVKDRSMLQGVRLEANNSPVFYPEGTVSNLVTILISNDWGSFKITLAITGRVKMTRL